jgi:hypothetical protein
MTCQKHAYCPCGYLLRQKSLHVIHAGSIPEHPAIETNIVGSVDLLPHHLGRIDSTEVKSLQPRTKLILVICLLRIQLRVVEAIGSSPSHEIRVVVAVALAIPLSSAAVITSYGYCAGFAYPSYPLP